jgi:hypothetical protein
MTFKRFERIALSRDIPEKGLKKGDIATIIEYHQVANGEDGYTLELFNALGDPIAVLTVGATALQPLTANEIMHARPLAP